MKGRIALSRSRKGEATIDVSFGETLVHPTEILSSVYYSLGIKPDTIVYNYLNQPRKLIQTKIVEGIFA